MRRIRSTFVALLMGSIACASGAADDAGETSDGAGQSAASPEMEILHTPGELEGLPFPSAVRVGHVLYLSGQIGNLPGTRTLAAGGVGAETRQTLSNIEGVLTALGSARERIFKCTVFLQNIADYAAMNTEYAAFFGDHLPARSTVAGSGLALGATVEIECLALAGT